MAAGRPRREMGRIVSTSRPSMRMPSSSTISRTVFLWRYGGQRLRESPAASTAAREGGVRRGLVATTLAQADGGSDGLPEACDARRQVRGEAQEHGRGGLGVGRGRGASAVRASSRKLTRSGELVRAEVGVAPRAPARACRGSGPARCACRRRGPPRRRRCRSRRCGPRGCRSPAQSSSWRGAPARGWAPRRRPPR